MLTSSKNSDAFLELVRLGIGHEFSGFPENVDWLDIKALAIKHGLSAVVLDGIEPTEDFKKYVEKEKRGEATPEDAKRYLDKRYKMKK